MGSLWFDRLPVTMVSVDDRVYGVPPPITAMSLRFDGIGPSSAIQFQSFDAVRLWTPLINPAEIKLPFHRSTTSGRW